MGWAAGSVIANDVWQIVRNYIPEHERKDVAEKIIRIFKDEDADDWSSDQLIYEDAH